VNEAGVGKTYRSERDLCLRGSEDRLLRWLEVGPG